MISLPAAMPRLPPAVTFAPVMLISCPARITSPSVAVMDEVTPTSVPLKRTRPASTSHVCVWVTLLMLPVTLSSPTVLPLRVEPILLISPNALRLSPPPALSRPAFRLLMLLLLSIDSPFCASNVLPLLMTLPPANCTLFPLITLPLCTVASFGERYTFGTITVWPLTVAVSHHRILWSRAAIWSAVSATPNFRPCEVCASAALSIR
ncbi:hypothetical protein D3C76_1214550 [compost metagenome]